MFFQSLLHRLLELLKIRYGRNLPRSYKKIHCKACNRILNDEEASIKWHNHEEIKNPEDRYINLCTKCLRSSDLTEYADSDYEEVESELDTDFDLE